MIPLSLYIHIPWCIKKCPYCDFNSHQADDVSRLPESAYLDALLADLKQDLAFIDQPRQLHSIFIGGGTPSLLSGTFYQQLLNRIRQCIPLAQDAEITLEANPGTADFANFAGFRRAGINRLSLGVQSFSDAHLTALGRIHSAENSVTAFAKARKSGFDNINIDLMHGLPQQDTAAALEDINKAVELSPEHISWYQLTIEPNTVFYKYRPNLPIEDILADIFEQGLGALSSAGYQQYEVSAFAKKNSQSQHNKNYWLFGDYLGIGAGAHGKITQRGKVYRRWKTRLPTDYLAANGNALAGQQVIDNKELPLEFLMNALRLNNGFEKPLFEQRTGLELSTILPVIQRLAKDQLLEIDKEQIRPTRCGHLFLNELLNRISAAEEVE